MPQAAMLQNSTSLEKGATETSLHVSKLPAEAIAPYSYADLVKSCMLNVAKTMFPDQKILWTSCNRSRFLNKQIQGAQMN